MTIKPTRWLFALAPLLGAGAADAVLPGGVSGPWYNPEQSGHGITVEVIAPDRALVFWHVFDRAGKPLTLYIEGEIHGRRIEGIAYAPRGMRFGDFDPANLQLPRWGEVDLEFDNCQQAKLAWRSDDEAFGSGELPLNKLADLQQDDCQLPERNAIPAGLYNGRVSGPRPSTMSAMVDGEGRLWALENYIDPRAGEANPGFNAGMTLFSSPGSEQPGCTSAAALRGRYSNAVSYPAIDLSETSCWILQGQSALIRFDLDGTQFTFQTGPDYFQPVAPLSIGFLVGNFRLPVRHQFFVGEGELRIEADGRFCVDTYLLDQTTCDYRGQLSFPDGDIGVVDYVIDAPQDGQGLQARSWGRGWVEPAAGEIRLRLAGPLSLIALRAP